MAFDTFEEGIAPGGLRSKNEIKILICYLYNSVGEKMSKELILNAVMEYEFANFFEISSAFDELAENGTLIDSDEEDGEIYYILSDNGKMIANQLETTLSYTVKEKSYSCAVKLLSERKTARENTVEIEKTENGLSVNCKISGGTVELLSFSIYAPDFEQAQLMKKNFLSNPAAVYKTVLALLSNDRESAGEALEEVYRIG